MTAKTKTDGWGEVTEAHLENLLKRRGVARTERGALMRGFLAPNQWDQGYGKANFFISRETAGRFARGFADENPLYVDLAYAEQSPWRRMLAPPTLLAYAESVNGATDGFPGCHAIWRECEFEWARPLFAEEAMNVSSQLTGARIVDSQFAGGKAGIQDYETRIDTLDGELVATYRTSWHRFSRKKATGESKYGKITMTQWTDDQLEALWDEYRRQNKANRRGSEPLYFEDVTVGTEVPHIVKGPVTLTSKLAFEFCRGAGGWFVGHEMALDLYQRYPALAIRNEENVPEPPVAIHWTNERCQTYLGMPGAYEAGFERLAWYTQLLTSWIGDHGCLRRLQLRFLAFHWQGDAIRLYATVTGKRNENGKCLVDLDIRSVSHPRGAETSAGQATVELPSRSGQRP
jgi:acyl dehydratase